MRQGISDDCARCRVAAPAAGVLVRCLRLAGHQVTPSRAAVIGAVVGQDRPFSAGELCAAVASASPAVGRATVFRTIDLLVAEGLLDRLYSLGSHVSYVVRDPAHPARPHHYLVCAACRGVTEIADDGLDDALRAVAGRHTFLAEGTLVEILGRCPAC
jgi:Fur family transcriptional regulator, ferric uptake regulator